MIVAQLRRRCFLSASDRCSFMAARAALLFVCSLLCGPGPVSAQAPRKPAEESERVTAQAVQPEPQPAATDALGDPLPAGARLRLGTLRFRAPSSVADMALSPDARVVVTVGDQ